MASRRRGGSADERAPDRARLLHAALRTPHRVTSIIKFASTIHVLPTTTAYASIVGCCNHMQEKGPRCRWRCVVTSARTSDTRHCFVFTVVCSLCWLSVQRTCSCRNFILRLRVAVGTQMPDGRSRGEPDEIAHGRCERRPKC